MRNQRLLPTIITVLLLLPAVGILIYTGIYIYTREEEISQFLTGLATPKMANPSAILFAGMLNFFILLGALPGILAGIFAEKEIYTLRLLKSYIPFTILYVEVKEDGEWFLRVRMQGENLSIRVFPKEYFGYLQSGQTARIVKRGWLPFCYKLEVLEPEFQEEAQEAA